MNIGRNATYVIIIILVCCAGALFGYKFGISKADKNCITEPATLKDNLPSNNAAKNQTGNNKVITYKTFSSPKVNFTFEYPSDWTYREDKDVVIPNLSTWTFYKGEPNDNNDNLTIFLEPLTDVKDFFSGAGSSGAHNGEKTPYWVRTYPSNDADTFITQEQNESNDGFFSGYIYWQKGKYFANADDVSQDYSGKTYVILYNTTIISNTGTMTETDIKIGNEIAQHMAQSVNVK